MRPAFTTSVLRPDRHLGGLWCGILLLGLAGGCQSAGPHAPPGFEVPRAANAELIAHLAEQPFVTAEGACRAAYLLAHDAPFAGEYPELVDTLRAEKIVRGPWKFLPLHYLTNGDIAALVCRACEIRTGLNWQLTGLGRYAWRELQYQGIVEGGSELRLMSGGEFVGILSRATDYLQRTRKRDAVPTELPPPPA